MKIFTTLLCLLSTTLCSPAAEAPKKPELKVAADGFPSGHDTPEGVACDLARAFIRRDPSLFTNSCIRLYVDGTGPAEYAGFLKSTGASMTAEAARKDAPHRGPKSIDKVFAARSLSGNGPASYGHAAFSFQAVMFVDVGVILHNDGKALNRTLVIRDKDGKWYVHPMPDVSPLLGAGLNSEAASEQDFSDAYELKK